MASARKVLLLNGPNLNLLGTREPQIYGTQTLDDHVAAASTAAKELGLQISAVQSNSASVLIDQIHSARNEFEAIVINPGAFTHYAWSVADALSAFGGPVVEVHISNPQSRESWRHTSVIAPVSIGTIAGFGALSYVLAMHAVANYLQQH